LTFALFARSDYFFGKLVTGGQTVKNGESLRHYQNPLNQRIPYTPQLQLLAFP